MIASRLREAGLDKKARRMVLSGAVDGFDSDILTTLPLSIEAKNQETWKPLEYMEQAQVSADKTNKMPVVIMSKNRLPEPLVMMRMDDWIVLLQRLIEELIEMTMVALNQTVLDDAIPDLLSDGEKRIEAIDFLIESLKKMREEV